MLLSQSDLTRILPQTYPFLMIDEVIEIKKGESLTAIKNITGNEWIFQNQLFKLDHMPEPLVIEAAAQAAFLLYSSKYQLEKYSSFYLGKIISEVFKLPVIGCRISLFVYASKMFKDKGYMDIKVNCDNGELVKVLLFYRRVGNNFYE